MGKTYKDIKKFDIKNHKKGAREVFADQDMRTRVKPVEKKPRGGAKNWQELLESDEPEGKLDFDEDDAAYHTLTGD